MKASVTYCGVIHNVSLKIQSVDNSSCQKSFTNHEIYGVSPILYNHYTHKGNRHLCYWMSLLNSIFCIVIKILSLNNNCKTIISKGSRPFKKVQFFLTLFKRPLTHPLLFEHLSYFAGGVFWTRFWAFDIMYLFHPQISPSMPQKSLFMQISCC